MFLGTRGEIDRRSRRHRRHSALLVRRGEARIVIDCGADWRGRMHRFAPTAVVVTHAHPDHAFGLADGLPCPVYATAETWGALPDYPLLPDRRTIAPGAPEDIGGVRFEAFPVVHSVRAPAVGYRVVADGAIFFYVPDVVSINDRGGALAGAGLFIGDGATVTRSMVRRTGGALVGHAPVRTQLGWCRDEGVPRALFTHCGSQIVGGDEPALAEQVRALGAERGVDAAIAHDGLRLALPG
jgi:phosphoribosyl 1,2-cyclic phosphodiesterase